VGVHTPAEQQIQGREQSATNAPGRPPGQGGTETVWPATLPQRRSLIRSPPKPRDGDRRIFDSFMSVFERFRGADSVDIARAP
jgi:hypothetical protein